MNITKIIILMLSCCAFFASNVANAAMSCCTADTQMPASQMQMDDGDMPCHEAADNDQQNSTMCDDCDCQHCVKVSALSPLLVSQKNVVGDLEVFEAKSFYSYQSEGILQPPKQIS